MDRSDLKNILVPAVVVILAGLAGACLAGTAAPDKKNMSLIPAGEFLMGSPDGRGASDEHPRHKVSLAAFYIDKREVTAAEYAIFGKTGTHGMRYQPSWSEADSPVVYVTWEEAAAFCAWAGKRLPTEAEWEKAALGGTGTEYGFKDDKGTLGDYAWYKDNSGGRAHPAGLKKPNAYALYDMHGNVWEWVSDWYDAGYYKRSPENDPRGPARGSFRVLKGGAWYGKDLRAAVRRATMQNNMDDIYGFRCAADAAGLK